MIIEHAYPYWLDTYANPIKKMAPFLYKGLKKSHFEKYEKEGSPLLFLTKLGDERVAPLEEVKRANLGEFNFSSENWEEYQKLSYEHFSTKWFSKEVIGAEADELFYEEVSLGEILQWELFYFFREILAVILLHEEVFHKRKPKKVEVWGNPLLNELLSQRASIEGIPLERKDFNLCDYIQAIRAKFYRPRDVSQCLNSGFYQSPRKKEREERKNILFVMGAPTPATNAHYITKDLEQDPKASFSLFAYDAACERLVRLKRAFTTFESYQIPPSRKEVNQLQKQVWDLWKRLKKSEEFKGFFSYKGVSFWPMVKNRFNYIFSARVQEIAQLVNAVGQILDREDPRFIFTGSDHGWVDRIFLRQAEKRKIPTAFIQFGSIHTNPYKKKYYSDYVFATNSFHKDDITNHGIPSEKVKIVGEPRYDDVVAKFADQSSENLRDRYKIPRNKKVILFASEPLTQEKEIYEEKVFSLMGELEEYYLVHKLHHQDGGEISRKVLNKYSPKNVKILQDVDILPLIKCSDIVLTRYSSVALETLILDKPLLLQNYNKDNYLKEYVDLGLADYINEKEDLPGLLKKWLDMPEMEKERKKKRKKFVGEAMYKADGLAGKRVLEEINRIMGA